VYIWASAYLLGPADPRRPFPWSSPPPWAAPLDANNHVITRDERKAAAENMPVAALPEPRSRNRREGSYVQGWKERDPFDAGSRDNWSFRRKPFVRDW
jgi:hypothetical protein